MMFTISTVLKPKSNFMQLIINISGDNLKLRNSTDVLLSITHLWGLPFASNHTVAADLVLLYVLDCVFKYYILLWKPFSKNVLITQVRKDIN